MLEKRYAEEWRQGRGQLVSALTYRLVMLVLVVLAGTPRASLARLGKEPPRVTENLSSATHADVSSRLQEGMVGSSTASYRQRLEVVVGLLLAVLTLVTAVICLLVALVKLRTARVQLRTQEGRTQKLQASLHEKEGELGNAHAVLRRIKTDFVTRLTHLGNLLIPDNIRPFVFSLVRLYFTENETRIIKYSRQLVKAIDRGDPIGQDLLIGSARIISDKCDRSNETASDLAFDALRNICAKIASIADVVAIYQNLLMSQARPHVVRNAVIGFVTSCAERTGPLTPDAQEPIAKLMQGILEYLGSSASRIGVDPSDSMKWAREAAIVDLRILDKAPHILNKLLPTAVKLVDTDMKNLIKSFGLLIENINVDIIDVTLRQNIYDHAEHV
jgi:hypothetical protein